MKSQVKAVDDCSRWKVKHLRRNDGLVLICGSKSMAADRCGWKSAVITDRLICDCKTEPPDMYVYVGMALLILNVHNMLPNRKPATCSSFIFYYIIIRLKHHNYMGEFNKTNSSCDATCSPSHFFFVPKYQLSIPHMSTWETMGMTFFCCDTAFLELGDDWQWGWWW